MSYSSKIKSTAVSGDSISDSEKAEVLLERLWMPFVDDIVFVGEPCVLFELGIDGRARFKYSGVH